MDRPGEFADRRSEAGETLVEVLLASALMALVVVGILGGVATMVLGSSVHRDQAEANPTLVSAMEDLKSPATARKCPVGPETVPAYTLPAGVTISKIEYQVLADTGPGFAWSDPTAADAADACDDTVADTGTPDPDYPLTLQRITLKYTHPDGNVDQELEFVKGDY